MRTCLFSCMSDCLRAVLTLAHVRRCCCRGYTREAYDALVARARQVLPNVALSTDMITGEPQAQQGSQHSHTRTATQASTRASQSPRPSQHAWALTHGR